MAGHSLVDITVAFSAHALLGKSSVLIPVLPPLAQEVTIPVRKKRSWLAPPVRNAAQGE